jgi:DNA-directed RNA polymerase subunit M/transcription elongation factor TFIIS
MTNQNDKVYNMLSTYLSDEPFIIDLNNYILKYHSNYDITSLTLKLENNIVINALNDKYISFNDFILLELNILLNNINIFNCLNKILDNESKCLEIINEITNYIRSNYFEYTTYIFNNKLKEIYEKLTYKLDGTSIQSLILSDELLIVDLVNFKPYKLSDNFTILNIQSIKEHEINMKKTPLNQTTKFKCPKCKKNVCSYIEKQIRSADEPMTAFITCNGCNYNWKE